MLRMSACAGIPRPVAQQGQQRRDHPLRAEHVDVEHRAPVLGIAELDGRRAERAARVVDERVHRAAGRELVAHPVDVGLIGDVGDDAPGCRGSAASASSRSARRAMPTTSHPCARNSFAVASPIPELAPVTTTRFAMPPVFPPRLAGDDSPQDHASASRAPARSRRRPRRSRPAGPSISAARRSSRGSASRSGTTRASAPSCWSSIGHAIQRQTSDSNNALSLYLFIYAFHMPAFAIISGYFSKATPPGTRRDAQDRHRHPAAVLHHADHLDASCSTSSRASRASTSPSRTGRCGSCSRSAIFRVALPYLAMLRWPLLWAMLASIGVGYFSQRRLDVLAVAGDRHPAVLPARLVPAAVEGRRLVAPARLAGLAGARRRGRAVRGLAGASCCMNVLAFREFDLQGLVLLRRLVPAARRAGLVGGAAAPRADRCSPSC